MTKIYFLHGFCGSGKTTYAKKLEAEGMAVRFSLDEWMVDLYGVNPPAGSYAEYNSRIEAVMLKVAAHILNQGGSVILDFGFWTRQERDEARAWAEEMQQPYKFLAFDAPEEVLKSRVLTRTSAQKDGEVFIDENAFNLFKTRFEPLQEDEVCEKISS
ncbi:MAG: ATP-binding protein [Rhodospirillales bacterium]|nr:ATP-binding protein [Rhodospirillales bacterium]MCB9965382.1 ATP-binding protein [Rhodospirillales bacterium]MCB9973277.1 ATP-binding protein [Rhodospirillales bacterium]MCB9980599.1 ATP-binding protein [Rhodospirillales bacterium]